MIIISFVLTVMYYKYVLMSDLFIMNDHGFIINDLIFWFLSKLQSKDENNQMRSTFYL